MKKIELTKDELEKVLEAFGFKLSDELIHSIVCLQKNEDGDSCPGEGNGLDVGNFVITKDGYTIGVFNCEYCSYPSWHVYQDN